MDSNDTAPRGDQVATHLEEANQEIRVAFAHLEAMGGASNDDVWKVMLSVAKISQHIVRAKRARAA